MIHLPKILLQSPACALVFLLIASAGTSVSYGQPGGKAFQFLEVTNSARVASLGGDAVAIHDDDPELAFHNPAMLNRDMHHHMTLNYVNYFAGINYGYATAAAHLGPKGTIAGGIHYLYYGTFQGADENGVLTGTFKAADYSINVMYSRPLDSMFTFGFTAKTIYSDYESYNSTALAVDAGITYYNADRRFTAGLVLRNMGMQVNDYTPSGSKEPLPFNIAIGVTKRLQYAPFTFYIVANHLERWDLTYETEAEKEAAEDKANGDDSETKSKSKFDNGFDQLMRHMVFGTCLNLGSNFMVRVGYNYRRRQELKIEDKPGMVGFSWGVGVKVSRFRISYGRATYHLAGGTNQFSLGVNLDEFKKKL
jgi:hypothetical protein